VCETLGYFIPRGRPHRQMPEAIARLFSTFALPKGYARASLVPTFR